MADTRENTAASPEAIYAKIARLAAETDRVGSCRGQRFQCRLFESGDSRHTAAATTLRGRP
jgi:hypothetical protein